MMKKRNYGGWNLWYFLLFMALVAQIILYYFFTKYWE